MRFPFALMAFCLGTACANDPRVDLPCGPGTTPSSGLCLPTPDATPVCGPGTRESLGQCVPDLPDARDISCGPGTRIVDGVCEVVPTDGGVVCGPGTHVDPGAGACVPDPRDGGPVCGAGTHLDHGACVPDPSDGGAVCGAGTHLDHGVCLPDPAPDGGLTCGVGTHLDHGQCLPNGTGGDTYEIRVAVSDIQADGFSPVPILVIGTHPDGSPSTVQVVLNTSRVGAGTFAPAAPKLGPLGATSFFTPCSSSTPGCVGTLRITAALATAPSVVVAESGPLNLLTPTGVGSDAPCLLGGNVMFFNGNDYIFNGIQTVTMGAWSAGAGPESVSVHVTPAMASQGLWWDLDFTSTQIGIPLETQVYNGAERAPFASPGHPGLEISGDGRGCNTLSGRFQIEELELTGTTLSRFTATFEQHCEMGPSVLRGCVHFEQ